jgi:predicted nucleic acid-binding protein
MDRYVFDSYALVALLEDRDGSQRVADLIASDDTEISMSVVNLGEVFYTVMREYGEEAACRVEARVYETGKIRIVEASWERVKAAARLKAGGGLSFADCFGAALARDLNAVLVTGDPEFERLEKTTPLRILWLT